MLARPPVAEKLRRPVGLALTILGVTAVLWATVRHGDPALLEPTPFTCLVCGVSGGIDVWRNVVLFMPLGVGLALVGVRPVRAALLGLALSLLVEATQATVLVGRAPSLSDLLTNTTGAALGALLVHRWRALTLPSRSGARRLAAAAAAVWLSALALTGAGLRWAEQPPYRVNQLPPAEGAMRAFEGVVHEATLNGAPVTPGTRHRPVLPAAVGDTLRLRARVTPSYSPGKLRPIIWMLSPDWSEQLVFGQRHRTLVARPRTASAAARFSSPTFVLRDAFPAEEGPVELEAVVTYDAVALRSAGPDGVREARFTKRLSLGWMVLGPRGTSLPWPHLVSAAWLAALVVPLAYWGTLAVTGGRRSWGGPAAIAGAAAASVALLTAAFGLAGLDAADWIGLALGVAFGSALATGMARVARRARVHVIRRTA